MSWFVLDSSALIAAVKNEPGAETVGKAQKLFMSAVNAAECVGVLVRQGHSLEAACRALDMAGLQIADFDRKLAEIAGALEEKTKPQGLSLGDRACLALALRENLPVLTADRHWKDVAVGVEIRLMR